MIESKTIRIIAFLLLFSTVAFALDGRGLVVSVADGDTLTIRTERQHTFKIRLYGIDAPERGQPYSNVSADNLKALCAGQTARVEVVDTDRYGRLVGVVYCQDVNVNLDQLTKGLAWAYRQYLSDDSASYISAETTAKAARKGLWQEPSPIAPWEWRRR